MFTDSMSFIVLFTQDLSGTKKFYTEIGASMVEAEENKVVIRLGEIELCFKLSHSNSVSNVIFYTGTNDLIKAYKIISNIKSTETSCIIENDWGTKEFNFKDNNGYQICVFEENYLLD
jgi:hypothetical protein